MKILYHYTNFKNLNGIKKQGLLAQIPKEAKYSNDKKIYPKGVYLTGWRQIDDFGYIYTVDDALLTINIKGLSIYPDPFLIKYGNKKMESNHWFCPQNIEAFRIKKIELCMNIVAILSQLRTLLKQNKEFTIDWLYDNYIDIAERLPEIMPIFIRKEEIELEKELFLKDKSYNGNCIIKSLIYLN